MRDIRFRAWHKKNKRMEFASMFNLNLAWTSKEPQMFGSEIDNFSEVMQSTGLTDKNGVPIYEGDIVKYYADGLPEDEQKGALTNGPFSNLPIHIEVLPWESKFSDHEHDDFHEMIEEVVYSGCSFYVRDRVGGLGSLWRASEHCEVIGNIWEDGELLK